MENLSLTSFLSVRAAFLETTKNSTLGAGGCFNQSHDSRRARNQYVIRSHHEENIIDTQYRQLKSLLLADIEDSLVCDLSPAVLGRAVSILETNVLRGMDAIHIGSAVALKADVFVSADKRQHEAAFRAGLRVALCKSLRQNSLCGALTNRSHSMQKLEILCLH